MDERSVDRGLLSINVFERGVEEYMTYAWVDIQNEVCYMTKRKRQGT